MLTASIGALKEWLHSRMSGGALILDNTFMRPSMLLALITVSSAAQDATQPLVNLGRLSIARVFGSEHGGGPEAEGFYGVRNAFDGGSNILNSIKYSSWNAGPAAFVIVRFSQPVTVTGIVVEGSGFSWMPSPESFTVQIRSAGSRELFLSSRIGLEGQRAVYATPRPFRGAREVMLTFQSNSTFSVEEIQILGPAPGGVDLSPVTPLRDPDVVLGASSESQANGPAQKALIRTLAGSEIAKMRTTRLAVDRGSNASRKAHAWLELNRAADQLAELMGTDKELESVAKQASALGVTVNWCEPGAHWFALGEGYEQYLQILPDGSEADDAWWMRRFRGCGDSEGSKEEYAEEIQWYSEFLKRFPNSSSHAAEARLRLQDAQLQYKAMGSRP
jgi:hypothetical protein